MTARWVVNASLAAGVIIGVAACSNHSKPNPEQPIAPQPAAGAAEGKPATRPDTMDAGINTPSLIARKAENYAQDLENLLAQRRGAGKAAATAPAARAAEPSDVAWADPNAPRARPTAGAGAADAAPVRPVIDAPGANQIASLTDPRDGAAPPRPVPGRPDRAPDDLGSLERKLALRVKENGRDVASHLDLQLMHFLKDESVPDLQALAALPDEDREMLSALLDGMTNFRSAVRADNNMLLSRKVRPLLEMSDRLRGQADLTIPTIALCTRVDGFGVYEPLEPARFAAGKEHAVIIYCEVGNFSSHLSERKLWETDLKQEEVLYTEMGMQVWPERPAAKNITDLSRNRRHDFFVVKLIKLPANLTIGRYLLKVSIQDLHASRIAEATVPIQIVAQ